jgi:hypothetical protein
MWRAGSFDLLSPAGDLEMGRSGSIGQGHDTQIRTISQKLFIFNDLREFPP